MAKSSSILNTHAGVGKREIVTFIVALLVTLSNFFASPASAQITFVKTIGTTATNTSGTTTSITVPASGVATGNSVILSFAMNPSAGAVACSDAGGNSYSADRDVTNGSGTTGVRTLVLSAHNVIALAGGNLITCSHPSVTARALSANEFSGIASTSARDQTSTGTGNNTAASSGSTATTTQAVERSWALSVWRASPTRASQPAVVIPRSGEQGRIKEMRQTT